MPTLCGGPTAAYLRSMSKILRRLKRHRRASERRAPRRLGLQRRAGLAAGLERQPDRSKSVLLLSSRASSEGAERLRHDAWRTGRRDPRSSAMDMQRERTASRTRPRARGCGLVLPVHAGPDPRLHGRVAGLPAALRAGLDALVGPARRPAAAAPRRRRLWRAASGRRAGPRRSSRSPCTSWASARSSSAARTPSRGSCPCAGASRRRAATTRPALARAAAPDRHADRPRARRGGGRATSTPPASRRGRATCGRPGSPITRRCATGSIAPLRATAEARRQPAAAGASSSAWTRKPVSVSGPNEVMSATSTASRPRPTIDPADARRVVARVEGVPAAVEVGLEPGREVHRLGGRRRLDVRDVAEHVAGGDVQRPAEGDRQVGEVAAHALAGPVGVGGRGPRVRRAGHPGQVAVDEVDDRLHPRPAGRQVAEALPGLVAELVGQAEAAGHDEAHAPRRAASRPAPPRRRARSRRPGRSGPARPRRRCARGRRGILKRSQRLP